jgi:hypothetical protein
MLYFPASIHTPYFPKNQALTIIFLHYDNSSKEGLPFAFFRAISTFILPVAST